MKDSETTRARLLVVDDSITVRMSLRDLLVEQGYDVLLAGGGSEGLEMLRSENVDVMLLDLVMPEKSGVDVLREVKTDDELGATPIILLTAVADRRELVACLDLGADDFVVKPWDEPELLGRLRSMVRLKRAHDASVAAHMKTEQLLTSISSILVGVDENDRIVRWNESAASAFGIAGESIVGQPFPECGIRWEWPVIAQHIEQCRVEKRPVQIDEMAFERLDGSEGVLEVTINPVTWQADEPPGFLLLAVDTTERRILQGQLVQARKLESLGQLAAGVAHEINTPIQYVGDNIRFLEDAFASMGKVVAGCEGLLSAAKTGTVPDDVVSEVEEEIQSADTEYLAEEVPKAIDQSLEGVERVSKIVKAMKAFSHPGSEKKSLSDVNQAIESTATVSANEWKYIAEMKMDLDPSLPTVPCFLGELNQVFLNIIVNAAHAIEENPKSGDDGKGLIRICTCRDGDFVEIRIGDTGTGIPEAARDRIFDPFFTTKEVGKGTGQGLAIARSVVTEKHGGTITFETETGEGTTFIIRLPLETEPASVGA